MHRSYRSPKRGTSASNSASLCPLLQRNQNASVIEQRCAALAPSSADGNHQFTSNPRRTSSPLRAGLSIRYTHRPIARGSPWQNGFAERLIGSIRRECLDHVIVVGEAHLRRILQAYAGYYNEIRTHRSLDKDAPVSRSVQRTGSIKSLAILGGLHHHYVRV